MARKGIAVAILVGMVCLLGCEGPNDESPSIPEWYPSTVPGYAPYVASPNKPLHPGQTEFTEEEVIQYAAEFINQRKELIGAESESLRLLKVKNTSNNPQSWQLSYEQSNAYKSRIVIYGTVQLSIKGGKVVLLASTVIPVVPVPDEPMVSDEVIRESLIGEKITYYDWGGNPIEYEVKEDDTIVFKDIVVFPTLRENTLEVRLCREVEVGQVWDWSFFYDVITGEKIHVRTNFWS